MKDRRNSTLAWFGGRRVMEIVVGGVVELEFSGLEVVVLVGTISGGDEGCGYFTSHRGRYLAKRWW